MLWPLDEKGLEWFRRPRSLQAFSDVASRHKEETYFLDPNPSAIAPPFLTSLAEVSTERDLKPGVVSLDRLWKVNPDGTRNDLFRETKMWAHLGLLDREALEENPRKIAPTDACVAIARRTWTITSHLGRVALNTQLPNPGTGSSSGDSDFWRTDAIFYPYRLIVQLLTAVAAQGIPGCWAKAQFSPEEAWGIVTEAHQRFFSASAPTPLNAADLDSWFEQVVLDITTLHPAASLLRGVRPSPSRQRKDGAPHLGLLCDAGLLVECPDGTCIINFTLSGGPPDPGRLALAKSVAGLPHIAQFWGPDPALRSIPWYELAPSQCHPGAPTSAKSAYYMQLGGTLPVPSAPAVAAPSPDEKRLLAELVSVLASKGQAILEGPPGTGKTRLAKLLASELEALGFLDHCEIVQFHQTYSYEDFIEGFKPMDGKQGFTRAKGILMRSVARAKKAAGPPPLMASEDPLVKACIAADAKQKPLLLIVDEINRANISKVMGELIYLLEYRGEAIKLQYSSDVFSLPPNLWLLGTMNSADRSAVDLDIALRRRFVFIGIPPDPALVPVDPILAPSSGAHPTKSLQELMTGLNKLIKGTSDLGPDCEIGHSFFLAGYGLPLVEKYKEEWISRFWRWALKPLLEDYCIRSEPFARSLVGKGFDVKAGRICSHAAADTPGALISLCD